jgi:uncharacterized protein YfaT (DUF1175 family)
MRRATVAAVLLLAGMVGLATTARRDVFQPKTRNAPRVGTALPLAAADRLPSETKHTHETAQDSVTLTAEQSRVFRAWMVRIIDTQIAAPSPRWTHRDCAGLVRFAVAEALRPHDVAWRRANAVTGPVPPEMALSEERRSIRNSWRLVDGSRAAYVGALELVQENTTFVGKDINQAQQGDLLFFDQGDDQHLMVWTGRYIGYHTGSTSEGDDGLRAVSVRQLMRWRDTRWQPVPDNPNFAGVYRLRFLAR